MATYNKSLGKFQLTGIPPAPRGIPQIEVALRHRRQRHRRRCPPRTSARARSRRSRSSPAPACRTKRSSRMVCDAESHADDDASACASWPRPATTASPRPTTPRSSSRTSASRSTRPPRREIEDAIKDRQRGPHRRGPGGHPRHDRDACSPRSTRVSEAMYERAQRSRLHGRAGGQHRQLANGNGPVRRWLLRGGGGRRRRGRGRAEVSDGPARQRRSRGGGRFSATAPPDPAASRRGRDVRSLDAEAPPAPSEAKAVPSELEPLVAERDKYLGLAQRAQADFDNLRKRTARRERWPRATAAWRARRGAAARARPPRAGARRPPRGTRTLVTKGFAMVARRAAGRARPCRHPVVLAQRRGLRPSPSTRRWPRLRSRASSPAPSREVYQSGLPDQRRSSCGPAQGRGGAVAMASRGPDHYKILGVDKKASQDEIKKAYRKLVRQYHPDHDPGDARAEERFKAISEAYDVLGDPDKRKKFDRGGSMFGGAQSPVGGGTTGGVGRRSGRLRLLPDILVGHVQRRWRPAVLARTRTKPATRARPGPRDVGDAVLRAGAGGRPGARLSGRHRTPRARRVAARARGRAPRPRSARCASGRGVEAQGQGVFSDLPAVLALQRHGHGHRGPVRHLPRRRAGCATMKSYRVNIPKGVREGSRIRLAGKGEAGLRGGPPGDLYVVTHVTESRRVRAQGRPPRGRGADHGGRGAPRAPRSRCPPCTARRSCGSRPAPSTARFSASAARARRRSAGKGNGDLHYRFVIEVPVVAQRRAVKAASRSSRRSCTAIRASGSCGRPERADERPAHPHHRARRAPTAACS